MCLPSGAGAAKGSRQAGRTPACLRKCGCEVSVTRGDGRERPGRRRAQVRTQTLVKNAIIQVDATPFKQFYQQHYGMEVGVKKRSAAATAAAAEAKAAEEKPAEGAEVCFPCPPWRRHTHTIPSASPHPFARAHPISRLPLPHALHYHRRHKAAAAAPASEVASPLRSAAAARAPSGQALGRAAARASASVEARARGARRPRRRRDRRSSRST